MGKKSVIGLSAFLLVLFCLFGSSSPSPGGVIIFCAGDSITQQGYPPYLQRILKRGGIRAKVLNYGRSGYTSGEYLAFLEKNKDTLAAEYPDFVLLQLGTNDVRADGDFTASTSFCQNMKKIIAIFREFINRRGKGTKIFLATILPIPQGVSFPFTAASRERVSREINPLIQKIAAEESILLVDNYSLFLNAPQLLPDIHPTSEGYRFLAENWFKSLEGHLKEK